MPVNKQLEDGHNEAVLPKSIEAGDMQTYWTSCLIGVAFILTLGVCWLTSLKLGRGKLLLDFVSGSTQ